MLQVVILGQGVSFEQVLRHVEVLPVTMHAKPVGQVAGPPQTW